MTSYAEVLTREDPRIDEHFNIEHEVLHQSAADLMEDPFPGFAELLKRGPVLEGSMPELMNYRIPPGVSQLYFPGQRHYSALSFAAVSRVLIENNLFTSNAYYLGNNTKFLGHTILNMGGTEHRTFRNPIQPLFSPDYAAGWWNDAVIEETVDVLVSEIERKGRSDLFLDLCARMPVSVISRGFGMGPDEIMEFRVAIVESSSRGVPDDVRMAAIHKTHDLLRRIIQARRKAPQDDIISRLVEAELTFEDGTTRPFTDEEIIAHCRLIVFAGGGTTWRQLGITLFCLLNDPEQLELLRADRGLMPKVVLESARWLPNDLIFPRMTAEDCELEGVFIPKDTIVQACLGSANRDPSRWQNADKFDITRPVQRSVAFAAGPHSCLGQHVSRQEMVVAMNAVLDRLPNVRWDPEQPAPRIIGGLFQRGPTALPVVWG